MVNTIWQLGLLVAASTLLTRSGAHTAQSHGESPSLTGHNHNASPTHANDELRDAQHLINELAGCFDANSDGVLDLVDVRDTIRATVTESTINTLYDGLDANNDGKIDFSEALMAIKNLKNMDGFAKYLPFIEELESGLCGMTKEDALVAAFSFLKLPANEIALRVFYALDINGDEKLPITSLVEKLKTFGVPQNILNQVVSVDADGNGFISEKEFESYLDKHDLESYLTYALNYFA